MIIACIAKDELINMGEFPSVEEAREVYGEQTEILGFKDEAEFDEFKEVVTSVQKFRECMDILMSGDYNF